MESIKQENDELKQTLSAVQVKYEKEQKVSIKTATMTPNQLCTWFRSAYQI